MTTEYHGEPIVPKNRIVADMIGVEPNTNRNVDPSRSQPVLKAEFAFTRSELFVMWVALARYADEADTSNDEVSIAEALALRFIKLLDKEV